MQTTRIRFREDTAQNWKIANPILASSEPGRETDTGKFKLGDGKTAWNDLPYATSEGNVTVDNTEVLNTLTINQTETTSNFNSIQTKLNEIEILLRQAPQEPVKSFDEQLAEMGYCMVTYVTDNGTITEMNKIGEFYNHLYYDKHISQREIFMGYSLSPENNEVITAVPGKCTLYPVYVKAPETPISINLATTLDGYWNCSTDDLIYESIGRSINGLNHYGMALAGFSLNTDSLISITNFDSIEHETTFYGPVIILGYDKIVRTVIETDAWYNNEIYGPFYKHPINVHLFNNEVYSTTIGQAANYYTSLSIGSIQYDGMGFSLDTGIEAIIDDFSLFMRDPNTVNVTDLYMVYDIYNHETGESSRKNAVELVDLYDVHIYSLMGEDRISYASLNQYNANFTMGDKELVFEGYSLNGNESGDSIVIYPEEFIIKNNIKTVYCVYSFNGVKYNYFQVNFSTLVAELNRDRVRYPNVLLHAYEQESFTVNGQKYEYVGLSSTPYPGELLNNFENLLSWEVYVIMSRDGEPIPYHEACDAYNQYING